MRGNSEVTFVLYFEATNFRNTYLCNLCYTINQVRGFCHLATFRLSGKQKMGKTGKFLKPAYNDLPKPIPGVSFKKGSYLTAFISQHLLLLASALNFGKSKQEVYVGDCEKNL